MVPERYQKALYSTIKVNVYYVAKTTTTAKKKNPRITKITGKKNNSYNNLVCDFQFNSIGLNSNLIQLESIFQNQVKMTVKTKK